MGLKIKIKETVEERRKLTIEERLLLQCRNNNYDVDMHFKKIGLVDVVHNISNEDFIGVFRKETIREMTDQEYRAYFLVKGIDINFFEGAAIGNRVGKKYNDACDLLQNKEIILELI